MKKRTGDPATAAMMTGATAMACGVHSNLKTSYVVLVNTCLGCEFDNEDEPSDDEEDKGECYGADAQLLMCPEGCVDHLFLSVVY